MIKTKYSNTFTTKAFYKGEFLDLMHIKPENYVWHVTRKCNRNSIRVYGLRNTAGLVFANNQNFYLARFWHVMDQFIGSSHDLESVCSTLDFWRIDTRSNYSNWFYDPVIWDVECGGRQYRKHYICTPQNIHRYDLTCYQYDPSMLSKLYIKEFDGVACINLKELPLRKVA